MEKLGRQEPLGEGYHQPGCRVVPEEKDIRPDLIYQGQVTVLPSYLDWESKVKSKGILKY